MQAEVQGPPGERGKSLEAGDEGGGQRRRSGYFRLRYRRPQVGGGGQEGEGCGGEGG